MAVVTVVLLVPVLFGAAAISVDVGNLLWERRQLQNGADATAMAAAAKCAESPTTCNPNISAGGVLDTLDNRNANDNVSTITSVCGNATAQSMSAALTLCTGTGSNGVADCPPVPSGLPANTPYLEVRTRSKTTSGSSTLTNFFARTLNGGISQSSVAACSRAGWGGASPTAANVLPIVMSYCDWAAATGYTGPGTATYPTSPDYSTYPSTGYGSGSPWQASWERKVWTAGNPSTCPTWNGHTAPGGFAALDSTTSCSVPSTQNAWYHGNTGNNAPCDPTIFAGLKNTIVYLPVFDCLTNAPTTITAATNCNSGSGNNTYYHVSGYAAFYLTGWYFSSNAMASQVTGTVPCTGGDRCMSGWFLKDLVSSSDLNSLINPPTGTPNFGLTQVTQLG
ncbi:pilus assembly protein TadG-related protein [Pedococcus sp. NPDC057267]|uniref:pilus assembly protein TadG-related protein n=1 Tax=Pedococcus sp. NPDC057267 TaxID=3346077 RepID=UPI00363338DC